jgi:hypothetical protein
LYQVLRVVGEKIGDRKRIVEVALSNEEPGGHDRGAPLAPVGVAHDDAFMLNLAAIAPASVTWAPAAPETTAEPVATQPPTQEPAPATAPVPTVAPIPVATPAATESTAPIAGGLLPETDTEPVAPPATSPILPLFLLLFALSPIMLFDLTRKLRAR